MIRFIKKIGLTFVGCLLSVLAFAQIKLPMLFSDNMVLQQQSEVAVWGWASPGEAITVIGSWNNKPVKTNVAANGKWMLEIKTPQAGGPYSLTIDGRQTIKLNNVMIGEVWICSGQSNMEMPLKGWVGAPVLHSVEEIKAASYPDIRLFKVNRKTAFSPQEDCIGYWKECSPESVKEFSATAYFFGKQLYENLDVPIGLVEASWGGTVAEAWTGKAGFKNLKDFDHLLNKVDSVRLNLEEMKAKNEAFTRRWKEEESKINKKFLAEDIDTKAWKTMKLGVHWEYAGQPGLDGVVWFQKKVRLPSSLAGEDLILDLGSVDDKDMTWFNGHLVGSENGWQKYRSYKIPDSIIKAGENIIMVRVTDEGGGGGIYGNPALLNLYPEGSTPGKGIHLAGNWKYKIEYIKQSVKVLNNPNLPTVLFNGMINPLIPFGIRGAIWYQGESNVGRAEQYARLFPAMIQDWREKWGEGDFPFYYVQIAPYPYGGNGMAGAALRDAQRKSLQTPNTGMVVTLDIGDTTNIHPANKEEVGRRLSLWALNKTYGKKDIVYSGPLYDKMKVKGNKAVIFFTNADGGLIAKGGSLSHFEIAGPDNKFVKAKAKIKGHKIILYSETVTHPKAVRYAWSDTTVPHLFNKAGLPASSFNTNF